jgi:hypothetical protein
MGFFDWLTTPTGGATVTTNTTTNSAPWIQQAAQGTYNTAQGVLNPYISGAANSAAGLTPDQIAAGGFANQAAGTAFGGGGPSLTGGAATANANTIPFASLMNPAQVGATDYQQFMNPYVGSVVDAYRASAYQNRDQNDAAIRARQAAAGAFGGARGAIAQSQNMANTEQQVGQMTAQLMSQGFDKAQAIALANAQFMQQGGQFNAQAQNTLNQFNTGQQNAAGMYNAGAINQSRQFDAGQSNQFVNDQAARQQNALKSLLGYGTLAQQTDQARLNSPLNALQMLQGFTPKDVSQTGTTVAPNTAPSPLATGLGLTATLFGAPMDPAKPTVGSNIWNWLRA